MVQTPATGLREFPREADEEIEERVKTSWEEVGRVGWL
jgi:hypothetical protein